MHSIVHRALVTYSDSSTGEIRVKIPAVVGTSECSISYIGRARQHGSWVVPNIGEQIIVSADDPNLTNVFWLKSDAYIAHTLTPDYGSFYDDTQQHNPYGQANAIRLGHTREAHNVSVADNSRITVAYGGVYNIQFKAQLWKTNFGKNYVNIWLRHNGVDVLRSDTRITVESFAVAAWNFVLSLADNDYVEIIWASDDPAIILYAEDISTAPAIPSPGIPSVTLTVTRAI